MNRPKSPLTPKRRKAYTIGSINLNLVLIETLLRNDLNVARKEKYETNLSHVADQCDDLKKKSNKSSSIRKYSKNLKVFS